MVTKAVEEVSAPQTELVIEAPEAPEVKIPDDIQEKGQHFIDNYVARLKDMTDAHLQRSVAQIESGTPVIAGYQYWNCLTVGPIQFTSNPPYLPNKIVAAGDLCLMLGVIWVNPAPGPIATLSGTTVLGGRPYRLRFETVNLSTVTNGPDATFTGTFSSLAPVVSVFPWYWIPPNPGPNPNLLEVNLTADITTPNQPFAAFSTWHFDLDSEPPFLGLPPEGPHTQFERPARFLVYQR